MCHLETRAVWNAFRYELNTFYKADTLWYEIPYGQITLRLAWSLRITMLLSTLSPHYKMLSMIQQVKV